MCGLIERISTKLNKDEKMDIEFNENIVGFSDGKIIASVLLREGRYTPVLWMKFIGLNEVSKLALEEEVFKHFEKRWNKPVTNADLWVNWEQDDNLFILRVEVKPSKDIKQGCFVLIDKIRYF